MTADEHMKNNLKEGGGFDFPSFFDKTVNRLLSGTLESYLFFYSEDHDVELPNWEKSQKLLWEKLKNKRKEGLKKYGERSFQSSINNLMLCPVKEHLEEEIVDAINYLLTLMFKANMSYHLKDVNFYEGLTKQILGVYMELNKYEEE